MYGNLTLIQVTDIEGRLYIRKFDKKLNLLTYHDGCSHGLQVLHI